MNHPVQAPPDTTPLTEDINTTWERDRRDAEAFRRIGQAGWMVVRRSEMEQVRHFFEVVLGQSRGEEVMPTETPATPNTATAERR